MSRAAVLALLLVLPSGCRGAPARAPGATPPGADPAHDEVRLAALAGWNGSLVLDQAPVGVWTVAVMDVFPGYGCPEIAALDDRGRFHALWSYSGKWTPVTTVHDGRWLGGLAQADVDARVAGPEIYVGSAAGNVWQVTAHRGTYLDCRLVAQLPGHEVHTLVAGELDPRNDGPELLAFTNPGGLFELVARRDGRDGFAAERLQELDGRIRDAVVLPHVAGESARIATVGRHGAVEILRFGPDGPAWTRVHAAPMGAGRIALRTPAAGEPLVLYSAWDDGRLLRHEERADGAWSTELVHVGPQGLRGLAAGRFDPDPTRETVAVFGYSGAVELLTRDPTGWSAETLFVDLDKGHWLAAGELDGRNATDELVAAGYSGRVVLLARPPGSGLAPSVSVSPDPR